MGTINNTIIIEEISRNGKLKRQHKYDSSRVNIGRSYQNDIIISDQHVNPDHINIHFNGEYWQLTDLKTLNGSFLGDSKAKLDQHIIQSGDVIRIGKSYLRFMLPGHTIPETLILSPYEKIIDIARLPLFLITIMTLFALLSGYLFYTNSSKEVTLSQFAVSAFSITIAFALWPLGVSLVSHLTKNESRIWHQLGVSFIFFNGFLLLDFIERLVFFNSASGALITYILPLFAIALALGLIWLNCHIGFMLSAKKRLVVSIAIVAFFSGSYTLINISKQPKFSYYPHYDNTLLPPKFLLKEPTNIDDFLKEAEKTFSRSTTNMKKIRDK